MFSIFKKFNSPKADFSFLSTDMHSHLIPGIDDGAKTIDDSILLIQRLKELGYKKIITTPHIMSEYYPNTPEIILSGLETLKNALKKAGINIEIEAAAEYQVDDAFEALVQSKERLLTFSKNNILIEFSMLSEPVNALNIIFQLKTQGYQPILAHPERYLYYANRFEIFEKIKSMGCSLQVNLLSLAAYYGSEQKKLGVKLLQSGLVDYLGTDLHRESQVKSIQSVLSSKRLRKLIKASQFRNFEL